MPVGGRKKPGNNAGLEIQEDWCASGRASGSAMTVIIVVTIVVTIVIFLIVVIVMTARG